MNAWEIRNGQLIEYIKLHLISLMQDLEKLENQMEQLDMNSKDYRELDFEFNHVSGQILATRHILSVASDIFGVELEEDNVHN